MRDEKKIEIAVRFASEHRLQKSLEVLKHNLAYLESIDVNKKIVTRQKLIIQSVSDYYQESQQYLELLERENYKTANSKVDLIRHLKDQIEVLEGICFIHGIMDLPFWLNKQHALIISMAMEALNGEFIKISYRLQEKIEKASKSEKEVIDRVFNRSFYLEMVKRHEKIEKLKRKIGK